MNIKPSRLVPNDPKISQMIEIWKGYNEDRHMLIGIANQTRRNLHAGEILNIKNALSQITLKIAHFCRVIYPPELV